MQTSSPSKILQVQRSSADTGRGGDIAQKRDERSVIDTYGLTLEELKARHPALFQHLHDYVLPERLQNRDKGFRERWWLFGRPRPELRAALNGLRRYIATSEVGKHRFFVFLDWPENLVDGSIVAVASQDAYVLGVQSSRIHVAWALAAGGRMGVGNDPRYQNGPCFDPFPFPVAGVHQVERVRTIAERLDRHRKLRQGQHADLTLTGMYNVLEKNKAHEELSAKEKGIHEQGLVSMLKQLHDELDLAVLDAYGWSDLAPLMQVVNGNAAAGTDATPGTQEGAKRLLDETLLERLVALNAERAAEEAKGTVRWLRPEFQAKAAAPAAPKQAEIEMEGEEVVAVAPGKAVRQAWPKELPDQVRAVADALAASASALDEEALAGRFKGKGQWKRRLPHLLETLESVGRARRVPGGWVTAR